MHYDWQPMAFVAVSVASSRMQACGPEGMNKKLIRRYIESRTPYRPQKKSQANSTPRPLMRGGAIPLLDLGMVIVPGETLPL
eukprot:1137333-Pelagomonas_calceolata.AAC.3